HHRQRDALCACVDDRTDPAADHELGDFRRPDADRFSDHGQRRAADRAGASTGGSEPVRDLGGDRTHVGADDSCGVAVVVDSALVPDSGDVRAVHFAGAAELAGDALRAVRALQ
nr:hypothetical protein [Tanacetum cinerariifolium]